MKKNIILILLLFCTTEFALHKKISFKNENKKFINKDKIATILQIKLDEFPDESVVKANFPRNDIALKIQNYSLDPFMGLTTWFAFQQGKKQNIEIMVMGDIVLLEHEVNPALSTALENNIKITALHNHFFYDNPKTYFMHIEAEGSTEHIALSLKKILETIKNAKKVLKKIPHENTIDGLAIEKILGIQGQAKNGMFKIVIGRTTRAACGCIVGKNMGINTWAAFGGTDDNALVDGDFVVLEDELQPVLKELRKANIEIVAIHNHMIQENPRLIFLHFWGNGKIADLAHGLKNALQQTKI